jgi:indole-3-glycerol phosphate synthase
MKRRGQQPSLYLLTKGFSEEYLPRLKKSVSLPVLRKDFIVDEIQVRESFMYGADAILLIVRLLSQRQLKSLMNLCKDLGMVTLVEVHDRQDLEKALESEAGIIGINNRNLETFEVDFCTTMALAPLVPNRHITVSESGIGNGYDIQLLMRSGINAVLVGSSIMKSDDVLGKARELVLAGKRPDGKG